MPEGWGQCQLHLPQGLFLSGCSILAEHKALYSQALTSGYLHKRNVTEETEVEWTERVGTAHASS